MEVKMKKDDNLSRLSIKFSRLSIIFYILSVALTLFGINIVGISLTAVIIAYILAIFGFISFKLAFKDEDENMGRCIKAKRFNIPILIIYFALYIVSMFI